MTPTPLFDHHHERPARLRREADTWRLARQSTPRRAARRGLLRRQPGNDAA